MYLRQDVRQGIGTICEVSTELPKRFHGAREQESVLALPIIDHFVEFKFSLLQSFYFLAAQE